MIARSLVHHVLKLRELLHGRQTVQVLERHQTISWLVFFWRLELRLHESDCDLHEVQRHLDVQSSLGLSPSRPPARPQ